MKKGKQKKTIKNNKNQEELNVTKEVGQYDGFLILEKLNQFNENEFQFSEFNEPSLKDWLIIQHNPNKTKSRFINLFQEILKDSQKSESKEEKNDKTYEENLLPNSIIDSNDEDEEKEKKINTINEKMNNINLNNNIIENDNIINNNDVINNYNNRNNYNNSKNIDANKMLDFNIKNNIIMDPNQNILNPINQDNKKTNINIIDNNFPNINQINNEEVLNINQISNNNNTLMQNQNLIYQYQNPNNMNNMNSYYIPEKKPAYEYNKSMKSNTSSNFPSAAPTAPSSMERKNSLFSILSGSSGPYFNNMMEKNNQNNNNNNDAYFYFSNKSSVHEQSTKPSEKKFDLNIDIKRIIYLEDRRTTLMIKNIPNKFNRDLLLKIIDQNFKGAYDLFILPTDANRYKNFGYAFINFTSSYYIPYFYSLFNNKKWSSTNSQKVCCITYSKIQGRNNLLAHYPSKIIFKNDEAKKQSGEIKYKIPNNYSNIFKAAFPNHTVENFDTYFITKMPFRY